MKKLLGLFLICLVYLSWTNLASAQQYQESSGGMMLQNGGTNLGPITSLNCSTNTTCSRSGPNGTITITNSGGGTLAPDVQFLVTNNNSTTPNTMVDFSFTSVVVGTHAVAQATPKTVNTGVNGVNGLDTGSLAANTWYYLYAISNATGSSVAGLMSVSSTTPTLPAGYTVSRRISTYRTDPSVHFYTQYQQDHWIFYDLDDGSANTVLSNGNSSSFAAVDCSSVIPPPSRLAAFMFLSTATYSGTGTTSINVRVTGSTNVTGTVVSITKRIITGAVNETSINGMQYPVSSAQSIDYMLSRSGTSAQSAYITVTGYYLAI